MSSKPGSAGRTVRIGGHYPSAKSARAHTAIGSRTTKGKLLLLPRPNPAHRTRVARWIGPARSGSARRGFRPTVPLDSQERSRSGSTGELIVNHDYDVAVVGYGPSGLVLASALGKAGHSVVVFERWPALYGLPRLTHIDGETARIVQAVGDFDHALRDALPLSSYRYLNGSGELLLELDWSGSSCGQPAHLSIYQPDIEDAIDAHVRASGHVEVDQGWSVVAVRPHDDGVELAARPWTQS